jgi:hypothetical protein
MKPLHNLRRKPKNGLTWIPIVGAIYLFFFFGKPEYMEKKEAWYEYQIAMFGAAIVLLICLILILKLNT